MIWICGVGSRLVVFRAAVLADPCFSVVAGFSSMLRPIWYLGVFLFVAAEFSLLKPTFEGKMLRFECFPCCPDPIDLSFFLS